MFSNETNETESIEWRSEFVIEYVILFVHTILRLFLIGDSW